jgi:glycosyltransferase involved in cell wall biosynthesis
LYRRKTRLILAGAYGGFEPYLAQLHALVASLGMSDVLMLGQVTDQELTALYDIADLFLCASEHEGFCVPIVEAFYKEVPVVALAATAVPATMDGAGVLFTSADPRDVAALMHAVLANGRLADEITAGQTAALGRLMARDFDARLLGFVHDALDGPRRSEVRVAPDFWRQYTLAEELETIRLTRPAAFRALPLPPDEHGIIADLGHRR